jgi:hypothetical protein
MPTPQRVLDEARAAEEQLEQLRQQRFDGVPPAPNAQPTNPPVDEPGTPPVSADNQFGQGQPVATPPGEGGGPITADQFAQLQQQLSTLQGRLNSSEQRLSEATGRATQLERLLVLRQQEQTPAAPPTPRQKKKLANPKLVEEYGEELVGLIRSVAEEEVEFVSANLIDQVQALGARVAQIEQAVRQVGMHVKHTTQVSFDSQMNQLVKDDKGNPDWQAINTMHTRGDTRFVDWLAKTDKFSREPRQQVLNAFYEDGDAEACAQFFNSFKAEAGLPDGTATTPSVSAPAPSPAASMVSPSTTGGAAPSGNGQRQKGRTFKLSEIEAHYNAKTKGHWNGRIKEWEALRDEMDKAVMDGRVIDDK